MNLPRLRRKYVVLTAAAVMAASGLTYGCQSTESAKEPAGAEPVTTTTEATAPEPPRTDVAYAMFTDQLEGLRAPHRLGVAAGESRVEKKEVKPQQKVFTYTVEPGDTVSGIAARFDLKTETVLWANDLTESSIINVGDELQIPSVDGVVHTVQEGDTLWDIAGMYGVSIDDIVRANPEVDPSALRPGHLLLVPGGTPSSRGALAYRGARRPSVTGQLEVWPASGPITDHFGWRIHPVYGTRRHHDGLDVGVPESTPLKAAAAGTVTMAGWYGGYGLVVRIDHGDGVVTQYAHMSQVDVAVGAQVAAGEHIGYSGNTGVSTGPHLHFMVIVNGTPVDPMGWLP